MRIRLIGGIVAAAVALGALALPGAMPAQAGSARCTGWTSTLVPPTSIRVYRTATRRTVTVPFRTYVEKVMAAEWGAGAPVAALRVGAVTVKQFAWYYAIYWRGGRDAAGRCYDVRDSSIDQVYDPARRVASSHQAAIAATWRVSLRKGERFFLTGYRPGTGVCGANLDGWKLYQRDAVNCVHRHGDLAEGLARRFFSYVSWITPGAGDYTGDGRGDLAVVSVAPDTGETTATVRTSDVPFRTSAAAGDLTGAVLTTVPADRLLGRAAGDVDGDGLADLVQLVRADDGVALEVMKASAAGFLPAARWWSDASDPAELGDGVYRLVVTDFTGDGVADAGVLRMRAGGVPVPPTDPSLPPTDPPTPPPDPTIPPDPPSTSVFVASSTGRSFAGVKRTWTTGADLSTSEFRAGDLNGDGLGDLVVLAPLPPAPPVDPSVPADPAVPVVPGGTALQVALAAPNGLLTAPTTWGTEAAPLDALRVLVGDPDRDGRDDLVVVRRTGDDASQIVVYRSPSAGTTFSRRYYTGALPLPFSATRFSTADASGDGRADLFALVNLGVDAEGNSLGTAVSRLLSDGVTFSVDPWFSDPALRWEAAVPY
jgi:FG-GAP-like repeat/Stage II sporulation protein